MLVPVRASPVRSVVEFKKRILKIQASLTAHWHDKGADWRGLAHTQAHRREKRISLSGERKEMKKQLSITADRLDTGANWRVLVLSQAHNRSR